MQSQSTTAGDPERPTQAIKTMCRVDHDVAGNDDVAAFVDVTGFERPESPEGCVEGSPSPRPQLCHAESKVIEAGEALVEICSKFGGKSSAQLRSNLGRLEHSRA